jgi:predicted flavoprotein YhiN
VIGAGAGGMMAAGRAAESGVNVLLLEKTDRPGQKLLISGNGRCNISNTAPLSRFIDMYGANGSFLHGPFNHFFRDDLLDFFARYGVASAAEEEGRIFPASGKAADIVSVFKRYLADSGARLQLDTSVSRIRISDSEVKGIEIGPEFIPSNAVILATGGSSYAKTGSNGDGYRMAARAGHTIVPLRAALVPIIVREKALAGGMQGASIEARLTSFKSKAEDIEISRIPAKDCGRGIPGRQPRSPIIESRTGDIMFTHYGISGPCALKMSLAMVDALASGPVSISINLRPYQTETDLRQEVIDSLSRHGKKTFINFAGEIASPKTADAIVRLAAVPPQKLCHQVNSAERESLIKVLKSLRFNVISPLSIDAAMVTAGGVSLREIDPHTMASRLVKGLYFCGEVMDLDAETGGFNLQAAFSTGHLSGEAAAAYVTHL